MSNTDLRLNTRDQNEWRIPRKGSLSYKIYQLLLKGKTATEIASKLKKPKNGIHVVIHRIKNPIKHNAIGLKSYHRRKKQQP